MLHVNSRPRYAAKLPMHCRWVTRHIFGSSHVHIFTWHMTFFIFSKLLTGRAPFSYTSYAVGTCIRHRSYRMRTSIRKPVSMCRRSSPLLVRTFLGFGRSVANAMRYRREEKRKVSHRSAWNWHVSEMGDCNTIFGIGMVDGKNGVLYFACVRGYQFAIS